MPTFLLIFGRENLKISSDGIPFIEYYGQESDYMVMVMELLGPSLKRLLKENGGKFSLKTVLLLADQMVCSYLPPLIMVCRV